MQTMRKILLIFCAIAGLLWATPAEAAFVCGQGTDTMAEVVANTQTASPWQDGWYGPRRHFNGEAHRAIRWAVWGLFFWPLGIFAVAHGFRALRRRSPDNDLAVLAIIMGSLEVIGSILFVILFFEFWWAMPFWVY
jgi:hypothetical protein